MFVADVGRIERLDRVDCRLPSALLGAFIVVVDIVLFHVFITVN